MTDGVRAGRVALLVEDDFDGREVLEPLHALRAAGVIVTVVGPVAGTTYHGRKPGAEIAAELSAGKARIEDFDAVVIPGGYAPDRMRLRHAMVDLVRDAFEAGKPVAAIDRGTQLLISVKAVRERTLTCWPSIAIDVKNAGGHYVDRPVVEDGNVITSRRPDDSPVFSEAVLRAVERQVNGVPHPAVASRF